MLHKFWRWEIYRVPQGIPFIVLFWFHIQKNYAKGMCSEVPNDFKNQTNPINFSVIGFEETETRAMQTKCF